MNPASLLSPADRLEMSRYIDLKLYHEVERSHPYYVEMTEELQQRITELRPAGPFTLLEIGAGTGLATEEFIKHVDAQITCLDFDEKCCEMLDGRLGERVSVACGDAVTFRGPALFDMAISVFAHDHIHYDRAKDFARNIRGNLKTGGYYLMGGEILPFYGTPDERREALHTYHGFIVDKALREGHFELAQIEINALKSGLHMIGDFKRHEALFEDEMSECFRLVKKKKIGPDAPNLGGVFVYVYQAL